MKIVLRNILAVIIGLFVGGSVNMLLISVGSDLVSPPAGVDTTQTQSLSEFGHLLGPQHFIFPFLAHALGTLSGAALCVLIAGSYRRTFAYSVGGFFLLGGITAVVMIKAPLWFIVLDLGLAYLPMAWLAIRLLSPKTAAS